MCSASLRFSTHGRYNQIPCQDIIQMAFSPVSNWVLILVWSSGARLLLSSVCLGNLVIQTPTRMAHEACWQCVRASLAHSSTGTQITVGTSTTAPSLLHWWLFLFMLQIQKRNLGEEGFVPVWGMESIMAEKTLSRGRRSVGHTASSVRKQSEEYCFPTGFGSRICLQDDWILPRWLRHKPSLFPPKI